MRSRSERRYLREKVIRYRKFIVQKCWKMENWKEWKCYGHFAKWNLRCSCWMCSGNKKIDKKRERLKWRRNRQQLNIRCEIDVMREWFYEKLENYDGKVNTDEVQQSADFNIRNDWNVDVSIVTNPYCRADMFSTCSKFEGIVHSI